MAIATFVSKHRNGKSLGKKRKDLGGIGGHNT